MTTIVTDSRGLPCNPAPLDIKGGQGHPQKNNDNHNINCHEQYKNIGRRAIIL
jgi:hypothetical protein